MTLRYPVAITVEKDDFVVHVRDFPEIITSGDNRSEALALAADAMAVALRGRIDGGQAIPVPSSAQAGEVLVQPDDL